LFLRFLEYLYYLDYQQLLENLLFPYYQLRPLFLRFLDYRLFLFRQ
jgi:hypothetical protein